MWWWFKQGEKIGFRDLQNLYLCSTGKQINKEEKKPKVI